MDTAIARSKSRWAAVHVLLIADVDVNPSPIAMGQLVRPDAMFVSGFE